jgi:microcystin-dependent protein
MAYLGEIRIFAGNFAPVGWAFCDGQLLAIAENVSLFNLIGTTYGGDGEDTFALPDLRGRLPLHQGTSSTGTAYQIGENGGVEAVTLTVQQLPLHTHPLIASTDPATDSSPAGAVPGGDVAVDLYSNIPAPLLAMNNQMIGPVGGSQPHENTQPFLCLNFILSLFGEFPSQT